MYKKRIDTELIKACRKNDYNKVKELLENGDDPNQKNNIGEAPLHVAFDNKYVSLGDNYLKILKLLLEYKANPDITNGNASKNKPIRDTYSSLRLPRFRDGYPDSDRRPRGIMDEYYDETVSVNTLIGGHYNDGFGIPAGMSIYRNNRGNELEDARTVLEKAFYDNDTRAMKVLLDHGANRKLPTSTGEVLLEIACRNSDIEMVKLLLSSCNNDVCSTLSKYNDKYLLKRKDFGFIERTTGEIAKKSGSKVVYDFINNRVKDSLLKVLVRSKEIRDIDKQDEEGNTRLHRAVKGNDLNEIDMLLKYKANSTIGNNYGDIPFSIACKNDNVEAALKLLKWHQGTLKKLENYDKSFGKYGTPLEIAKKYGSHEFINKLNSKVNMSIEK